MLTADLAISWQRGKRISPGYLDAGDDRYLRTADDLIRLFGEHLQRRRGELEAELNEYVGTGTDYKILRGLIKLLFDRCTFETAGARDPAEIRQKLFFKAAAHHPINPTSRAQLVAETAAEFGLAPESVVAGLYADLPENQRLLAWDELAPRELLDRYNLAQAQALLYRCVELKLWIEPREQAAARRLFQAIKHYGLIHAIRGNAAAGYEVTLSGPVSLFHRSQKYGVQMAVFLPALLETDGWRMSAEIESKRGRAAFELDAKQRTLTAPGWPGFAETGAAVEKFMAAWARLGGEWQAELCREVIDLSGGAFIPDVVLRAEDGRRFYIELFGFWTPRYLQERLAELARGGFTDFVLLITDELRAGRDAPSNLPPQVVTYKTSPDARAVRAAIEKIMPA